MKKLAIKGGKPVSDEYIYLTKPWIGQEEIDEVVDTLKSVWISRGPKVTIFENNFAEYIRVPYAITTSSCTTALHLGLIAAGVKPGDEVITSAMTFVATANAIIHAGAKPVFVDVNPNTLNIDPYFAEEAVTEKTKAIIPVHIAGRPCYMTDIMNTADEHNLFVLEDAAHGAGASYRGQKLGSIGHAGAFSFYASKNIVTGDGGMLTTRMDEKYAEFVRIISLHGISSSAWKRYSKEGESNWQQVYPGFKANMTDIQAAIGIHQLKKIDLITQLRTKWANLYTELLKDVQDVTVPFPVSKHSVANWHLYIIKLSVENLKVTRDEFVKMLKAENIGTGIHFVSVPKQPYYVNTYGYKDEDFPVASWLSDRIISLPLYPQMTEDDVHKVVEAIKKVLEHVRK